jgi:hypothetical protein
MAPASELPIQTETFTEDDGETPTTMISAVILDTRNRGKHASCFLPGDGAAEDVAEALVETIKAVAGMYSAETSFALVRRLTEHGIE